MEWKKSTKKCIECKSDDTREQVYIDDDKSEEYHYLCNVCHCGWWIKENKQ